MTPEPYRRRPDRSAPGSGEEGVALVLVLVFIALLAALTVDFSYEIQVEAAFAENRVAYTQAELAARSAVASCMALLLADREEDLEQQARGRQGRESRYDSLTELWAEGVLPEDINDGIMQGLISDEYGKLNVNALIPFAGGAGVGGGDTGNPDPHPILDETLRILFEYRLQDRTEAEAIVDALLDWLDPDPDIRPAGAEWDYYEFLDVPYAITDGPMRSIEELLLIPGITPDVYFGDPELDQVPLPELLTVYGHPEGWINVNTAHRELLTALLEAMQSTRRGDELAQDRDSSPFNHIDQLEHAGYVRIPDEATPGQRPRNPEDPDRVPIALMPPPVTFWSKVFRITGDGLHGETQVRIEAYVWRSPDRETGDEALRILHWRLIR
jgi:general secretion pathway protein K